MIDIEDAIADMEMEIQYVAKVLKNHAVKLANLKKEIADEEERKRERKVQ